MWVQILASTVEDGSNLASITGNIWMRGRWERLSLKKGPCHSVCFLVPVLVPASLFFACLKATFGACISSGNWPHQLPLKLVPTLLNWRDWALVNNRRSMFSVVLRQEAAPCSQPPPLVVRSSFQAVCQTSMRTNLRLSTAYSGNLRPNRSCHSHQPDLPRPKLSTR